MKRVILLAGILIAWPLLAQDPPAQNPPAQTPPPQTPAPQTPPAQNPPALEPPKMEEPGTAPDDTKAPPKRTDTPTPKVEKKAGASEGKVVEEIVARVNNEIITRSELDKARTSAADSAREDCNGRCSPEQLQVAVEDSQKFALRDL